MKTSSADTSPPSSLPTIRPAAQEGIIPSIGDPTPAYVAVVFVGAWNSSGKRVPAIRERAETAVRCPSSP